MPDRRRSAGRHRGLIAKPRGSPLAVNRARSRPGVPAPRRPQTPPGCWSDVRWRRESGRRAVRCRSAAQGWLTAPPPAVRSGFCSRGVADPGAAHRYREHLDAARRARRAGRRSGVARMKDEVPGTGAGPTAPGRRLVVVEAAAAGVEAELANQVAAEAGGEAKRFAGIDLHRVGVRLRPDHLLRCPARRRRRRSGSPRPGSGVVGGAVSRKRPPRSVKIQHMLAGNGALAERALGGPARAARWPG